MSIKTPLAVILAIGLLVLLSVGIRGWDSSMHGCSRKEPRPIHTKSTEIRYVQDTTRLSVFRDEIRKRVGDSLRKDFNLKLAARRAALRMYTDSGRFIPDTAFVRDTVCLAGDDLREDQVLDSAEVIRGDSARNALAECSFDRDILAEELEDAKPIVSTGFAVASGIILSLLTWMGIQAIL